MRGSRPPPAPPVGSLTQPRRRRRRRAMRPPLPAFVIPSATPDVLLHPGTGVNLVVIHLFIYTAPSQEQTHLAGAALGGHLGDPRLRIVWVVSFYICRLGRGRGGDSREAAAVARRAVPLRGEG
ncbi:hypothetical protein E2C01_069070 [Portunus trituberculatus]|uniref:Uncharacterized protein n=1 Tax=Portunus trituberculatus TaxID=210409 RepID=A0A5B7HZM3_PORTR|nr:hypothetical protein [Portunus trituberculatus]